MITEAQSTDDTFVTFQFTYLDIGQWFDSPSLSNFKFSSVDFNRITV